MLVNSKESSTLMKSRLHKLLLMIRNLHKSKLFLRYSKIYSSLTVKCEKNYSFKEKDMNIMCLNGEDFIGKKSKIHFCNFYVLDVNPITSYLKNTCFREEKKKKRYE